jgi:hypothetical protein
MEERANTWLPKPMYSCENATRSSDVKRYGVNSPATQAELSALKDVNIGASALKLFTK